MTPVVTPVWALVPVRSFKSGKSRLAGVGPVAREQLARALCDHVLATLAATPGIAGIAVATDGDDVAEAAIAHGASVIFDPPKHGGPSFAAILDRGLDLLTARGAAAAAIVMADLPRLATDDVAALLAGLDGADVVLAPDRYQLGTNALALALPAPLATCFGHGDSYARHLAAAIERGLGTATCVRAGLGFDLDWPDDLAALVTHSLAPSEAETRVLRQRLVGAEDSGGIDDTIERIDLLRRVMVVDRPVEGAQNAVQGRPLGGDPADAAGRPS
jgi:2-phospho-L-lactate guanylyltransferase